jgi:outer membrane immunogenic protein
MKTSIRRTAFHCLTFAAAVAASTAAATPLAGAADLPVKVRDVVVRPLWTGYYIGVHGGWGWGSTHVNDPTLDHPIFFPQEYKSNGPIAGGQIGANWQFGNVVYGAEIDGSWASMRSDGQGGNVPGNPIAGQFNDGFEIRALATATGRVGYTMGNWLVYAKAGGAWANIKARTGSISPVVVTHIEDRFGPTAGAGMEVALLRNVSGKIEYNFVYLPEHQFRFVFHGADSFIDHYVHLFKAGINVRFGGDHVAAR